MSNATVSRPTPLAMRRAHHVDQGGKITFAGQPISFLVVSGIAEWPSAAWPSEWHQMPNDCALGECGVIGEFDTLTEALEEVRHNNTVLAKVGMPEDAWCLIVVKCGEKVPEKSKDQ